MDFQLYEPEDFASDESYLRYYFRLNENDISFWQTWISNHPAKLDCIINADQLISLLSLQLDEGELSLEYQRLLAALDKNNPTEIEIINSGKVLDLSTSNQLQSLVSNKELPRTIRLIKKVSIAAAIIITVLGTSFYFLSTTNNSLPAGLTNIGNKNLLRKINHDSSPLKFQLEDGSIITLQPGSALDYPQNFLPAKREVLLEGEAFFEVSKDKKRPFYVYCQNLVAHVLGTSFNIKSDKLQGKIEVAVSIGKVEVYEKYKEVVTEPER